MRSPFPPNGAQDAGFPDSVHDFTAAPIRRSRPELGDQLVARALLGAMDPHWEVHRAAGSLLGLAAGDEFALRRALARIQRRSLERATPVAERAAWALRLTLDPQYDRPPPPDAA